MRGTPQQIIDKYNQLARDAQLSNDRVAAENFQQHAEHYLRMLGEAQKEADAKREAQEAENRARQQQRDQERQQADQNRQQNNSQPAQDQGQPQPQPQQPQPEAQPQPVDQSQAPQPDLLDVVDSGEASGLVETPESKPKPKRKYTRKPKAPKPEAPEVAD